MVIYFNSEKARKQLLDKGMVITFRKRNRTIGYQKAVKTDINNRRKQIYLCMVKIEKLEECYYPITNYLFKYVKDSGFKDIHEWIEEICKLNNNRWLPEYGVLYKVIKNNLKGVL